MRVTKKEQAQIDSGFLGKASHIMKTRYGFRGTLLRLHGLLEWYVLRTNQNGVLIGRDGWNFLSREGMMDYIQRTEPLTQTQISTVAKQVEFRQAFCASIGTDYVRIFAPNKSTIYSEYLPEWVNHARDQSRLDQLLHGTPADVVKWLPDLRPPLIKEKANRQLYFKNDSHWNSSGALVVLNATYEHLNQTSTRVYHPINEADYEPLRYKKEPDLNRFMGLIKGFEEEDSVPLLPHVAENKFVYNFPDKVPAESNARFWKTWGKPYEEGGYTTYAWNPDPATPHKRCVLVGDSFAEYWPPLLKNEFQEVVFIHERELPISSAWFREFQPDVLLDFSVERKLMGAPKPVFDHEPELPWE